MQKNVKFLFTLSALSAMEFILELLSDLRAVSAIIKRLSFWSESKGLKSVMPESFVTLDRYKADLSRYVSRDKLLCEMLEARLKAISNDVTSDSLDKMALIREVLSWIRQPIDFWITPEEWCGSVGSPVPLKPRFSSVADGVQTHFEFEGER